MQVFDHQIAALEEITARARAFYAGIWRKIPIRARFHSLLVGPTGTGKTTLATMAAKAVGVAAEVVRVSVPGWVPAGSTGRSVAETIKTIAQSVDKNKRTLLVLDELDKACAPASNAFAYSDSPWQQHCRLEIYELLDGQWPQGLQIPDTDGDNDDYTTDETHRRELLTQKLQETVFILGVGTFQSFFDSAPSRRTMGFCGGVATTEDEISLDVITDKLPRELTNRFGDLIRLPELRAEHYRLIARQAEESLPEEMRQAFRLEIARRIESAISAKKGVRFIEEALLEVLKTLPPEPPIKLSPPPSHTIKTDPIDTCIL
jgi:SpoVK/Ycf46/Vps4 family AAA+-type ATPase